MHHKRWGVSFGVTLGIGAIWTFVLGTSLSAAASCGDAERAKPLYAAFEACQLNQVPREASLLGKIPAIGSPVYCRVGSMTGIGSDEKLSQALCADPAQ